MRLFSLCYVIVITSGFPENDLSTGRSYATEKVDARISGGEPVTEDFFYHAQIIFEGDPFCSGAIINPLHVLTAAHCFEDVKPDDIITLRIVSRKLFRGPSVPIAEIVTHPEYDYPQNNFDIAYLRTTFAMDIDPNYEAVSIPDVNTPLPREVTVSGFGYTGKGDKKLSVQLMFVKFPIISELECQAFYPEKSITKNMICAHSEREMEKGTCPGDGGDPAVDKDSKSLIGISSFSRGCGPGQGPSVFTFIQAKEIHDFIIKGTKIDQKKMKLKPDRSSQEESKKTSKENHAGPSKRPQFLPGRPRGPSKEESERPSIEKPERPCQEESKNPSKENHERPSDEIPHRPSGEIPESSFEELPEGPSDEVPDRPSDEIPESPFEELSEGPSKEKPESPSDEIPERPFEEKPEKPSEEKPERPFEEYSEE